MTTWRIRMARTLYASPCPVQPLVTRRVKWHAAPVYGGWVRCYHNARLHKALLDLTVMQTPASSQTLKHALILEDVVVMQTFLDSVLRGAFPEVQTHTAATVAQALELIERRKFDFALVDLELPDASGIKVIEQLNRKQPSAIVVVASIHGDDAHLFPALQAGAQGYLLKDEPAERMVMQLQGILRGNPPLSPAIARRMLNYFQPPPIPSNVQTRDIDLTPREIETLKLLAQGLRVGEVAQRMNITTNTASGYVKVIYRKLNVSSRAEAALKASRMGLVN